MSEAPSIHKLIGARLAECRRAAGYTQQSLSDAIGWHVPRIRRLENGHNRLLVSDAMTAAALFGCEVSDLLPEVKS